MKLSLICAGILLLSGPTAMAQSSSLGASDTRGGANGPTQQIGGDPSVTSNVTGSTSSSSMLMYTLKQASAGRTARTTNIAR